MRRFAPTAAVLALTLALGACSLTVDGGSSDSAGSASQGGDDTTQSQAAAPEADDAASAVDDAVDEAVDKAKDAASEASVPSDISDPGWVSVLTDGNVVEPDAEGKVSVTTAMADTKVVGEVTQLDVSGAMSTVAAEKVGTLIVSAADVTVYVRSVDKVVISGANVTVHWLEGDPQVDNTGVGNTATKLEQ